MAVNSSSFLPSSGNTGTGSSNSNNIPKTPKSPGRSRFSKALPAPPPVLEKLLPMRSASRPSTSADETPSLPPLPPPSSAVLSSPSSSYIPMAASPVTTSPPSATVLSVPPPPPKSSARTAPGTISSMRAPSLSLFPQQAPPPLPEKKSAPLPSTGPAPAAIQSQPLPQIPLQSQPPQPAPSARGAIRRRPVASSVSVASSDSNRSLVPSASPPPQPQPPQEPTPAAAAAPLTSLSVLPRLPDLPSFNSFSSLHELPAAPVSRSVLPELAELPSATVDIDASSSSETQSQTKTLRAPSPPPLTTQEEEKKQEQKLEQEQEQEPSSSRVASISSILSAYSENSSPVLAGLSSSNSEATISTNTSSVMAAAASSPLRPLPSDKGQQVFLDVRQPSSPSKLDESVHTPLSYLLDGDYVDDDQVEDAASMPDEKATTNGVSQNSTNTNSDEYDPYSDAYYSYRPPLPKAQKKNDTSNATTASATSLQINGTTEATKPAPNSLVPPAPISKTEAVLPPRSTSLRHPPPDVLSKTVTTEGSKLDDDSLPPLPTLPHHSSTPSTEIWKRRSEKAETNLSVTELNLKATPALQSTVAVAVAADAKSSKNKSGILQPQKQLQPQPQPRPQQQQQQQQLQAHTLQNPQNLQKELPRLTPANDASHLASAQPLPPPQSPLPPPPTRSALNQLQPPKSPLVGGSNANGASPSLVAPSPRLGLPGRDIRPSRQASPAVTPTTVSQTQLEADAAAPTMGSSLAKFENKVESTFKRKPAPAISVPSAPAAKELPPPPPPSFQRPPTPEYDDEDKFKDNSKDGTSTAQSAIGTVGASSSSTTVVNVPVSPAASPAASPAGSMSSASAQQQQQRQQRQQRQQPSPSVNSGLVGREIRPVKSVARLADSPDQLQQPQQPQQQPQPRFTPRTSSRNVSISTIPGALAGPLPPAKEIPAPLAPVSERPHADSAVSFVSESGSQVTIKAVAQKQLPSPESTETSEDLSAAASTRPDSSESADHPLAPGMPPLFPTGYMTDVITPDTVFAAPPPSKIQFQCLQGHRDMFRDRNVNYPLSCQTCQTFERSMRWRCKWCYLRVCSGCRDVLHTHAKHDLAQLLTYLAEGGGKETVGVDGHDLDGRPVVHSISSAAELPVIQEA
ncbi:hypothetical protein SPBR_02233 [Sporothrix brasiliensis 5110]|uniref:Uncharacterized protein n=1 Tax=Sporothrix brasiliensis 5110 TaxID=1398154 RepID=A0A0C2FMB9_9PEZI|nr:uncharacterized protein SPBR_02233 [Sporothrix brasiliensis 5110]KIH92193.1 hypothetical protein SPBR_02233 [Sporothrix brasiliensis 5110]